ncbi:MAG: T9SS type A sorting domain-containing protein [Crocinitomicaceae bacterium]|nr:T9SS type A sorting domain-containing protein [Crocinitomicaceae bacterium]
MKKTLLFAALSMAFAGNSQSLTQANEAAIGSNVTMYVCDSIDAYSGTQGMGVTWDYSNVIGLTGQTRVIGVDNPASTTNASSFTSSTFAISAGSLLTSYYTSTSSERISQGFVFNEPTLGDVIAQFDIDEAKTMDYPFSNGDSFTDNFSGQIDYVFQGFPQNSPITGTVHASIDGQGTLLLPNSTSLTDVIRYKTIDTTYATIALVGDIEIIRSQYEYYDILNTSLPVFTHSTIIAQSVGSTNPLSAQTMVLSSVEADNFLSINDIDGAFEFSIYPNPSQDVVTLSGEFSSNAVATILDYSGRVILSETVYNGKHLNITSLDSGMYVVRVNDNNSTVSKKLIKK